MANIYDKASLVMIPSGTKTSKIFSQKPVNGDGDFTFSRSTAATRVNADGNIEKETQNLLTYSNDFSQWTFGGVTRTGGQSGYDGSNNAWLITATNVSGVNVNQIVNTSEVKTYSIYAKAGTTNWIRMSFNDTGINSRAWFDLTNGVVGTIIGDVIDTEITSLGSGWYRCSISVNLSVNSSSLYLFVVDGNGLTSASVGDSVYIQDAQLEVGLAATDYIESGATTGKAGLLEDEPRFDYSGGATCPSLLLEGSRTNLITQSEYYGGSAWIKTNVVVTDNDAISPEGVQNAAKVVTSSGSVNVKQDSISVTPSTTYTFSFWCKLTSGTTLKGRFYDNTAGADIEYYDYTSQLTIGEWARVERTFTTPAGCTSIQVWLLAQSATLVTAHYWGAQAEAGSYPTSYIPNHSGGSVTRGADSCYKIGISSLIGQTEGTLFIDINNRLLSPYPNEYVFYLTGTGGNQLWLRKESGANNFTARLVVGGSNIWTISVVPPNGLTKIAIAYKSGDSVVYLNGTQVNTSSATFSGNVLEDFYFSSVASTYPELKLKQAILFNERLTNAELATLTTL